MNLKNCVKHTEFNILNSKENSALQILLRPYHPKHKLYFDDIKKNIDIVQELNSFNFNQILDSAINDEIQQLKNIYQKDPVIQYI